jgi:hypothetical protein
VTTERLEVLRPSPHPDPDYWPPAGRPAPGLRQALLTRFATDLAVLAASVLSERPADQQCCWVHFEHKGEPWIAQPVLVA